MWKSIFKHLLSFYTGCLSNFLATLCRTVNIDSSCQNSWRIMKNLLGTHLGHSGIYTMCNFMEVTDRDDGAVVRGAVFFVGASLWGTKTIRSLKYSPNSVLNSFDKVSIKGKTWIWLKICKNFLQGYFLTTGSGQKELSCNFWSYPQSSGFGQM